MLTRGHITATTSQTARIRLNATPTSKVYHMPVTDEPSSMNVYAPPFLLEYFEFVDQ